MSSLFKVLEFAQEKLAKDDGQYIRIPANILTAVDDGKRLAQGTRSAAERVLKGRGKINPEDFKRLVKNGHPDVLNPLFDRNDISQDQLMFTVRNLGSFRRHRSYSQSDKNRKLFNNIMEKVGDEVDDGLVLNHLKEANVAEVIKTFNRIGKKLNKEHVDEVINREWSSDIPEDLPDWDKNRYETDYHKVNSAITNSPGYDAEHAKKVFDDNKDHKTMLRVFESVRDDVLDEIIPAAINHENESFVEKIYDRKSNKLDEGQLRHGIDHESDFVAYNAMKNVREYPELFKYAIDEQLHRSNSDKISNMLSNEISRVHFDSDASRTEYANKILNYAANSSKGHQAISKWSDIMKYADYDHLKKVATADYQHERSDSEWENRRGHEQIASLVNGAITEAGHRFDKRSEIESHVLDSPWGLSNDIAHSIARNSKSQENIRRAWNNMSSETKNPNEFVVNKNIPGDVLEDILSNHVDRLNQRSIAPMLMSPALRPEQLTSFIQHPDAGIRYHAANNPNASSEQIMMGLSDKNKDVRGAWIERKDLNDDHLRKLLKDRSKVLKKFAAKHDSMSPELVHEIATKQKKKRTGEVVFAYHPDVRNSVLDNKNMSSDTAKWILENDKNSTIAKKMLLKRKEDGSSLIEPEYITNLVNTNPNPSIISHLGSRATDPQVLSSLYDVSANQIRTGSEFSNTYISAIDSLARNEHFPEETLMRAISDKTVGFSTIERIIRNDSFNDDDVKLSKEMIGKIVDDISTISRDEANYRGLVRPDSFINGLSKHKNFDKVESERKFLNSQSPAIHEFLIDQFNKLGEETQKKLTETVHDPKNILSFIRKEPGEETSKILIDRLTNQELSPEDERAAAMTFAARPEISIPSDFLNKLYEGLPSGDYRAADIKQKLIMHPSADERLIKLALNDSNSDIKNTATKKYSLIDPDAVNNSLDGAQSISTHPAIEKLKVLKGLVEESGGEIHKNELNNKKGFGGLPPVWDQKGKITSDSIDKFVDELPKSRFNISYGKWSGIQRHDHTRDQKVVQVNLSNDIINELKEKDLYHTYVKDLHVAHTGSHPVRDHTIGWVRVDDKQKDSHWHFDEVQSDIMRKAINKVSRLKGQVAEGTISEENAKEKHQKIKDAIKIISGGFKSPNHAVWAATHQLAREHDVTSVSLDTLPDQVSQSGQENAMYFFSKMLKESKKKGHVTLDEMKQKYPLGKKKDHQWDKAFIDLKKEFEESGDNNFGNIGYEAGSTYKLRNIYRNSSLKPAESLTYDQIKEHADALKTHVGLKDISGFMNATYEQLPESEHFSPKPKDEVMPDHKSEESIVQYKKLIKSMDILKFLLGKVK